jgi:hypothetical protein
MDFANTPDGWKLIELNSQPGICPVRIFPEVAYTMTKLANYLGTLTKNVHTPLRRKALALPVPTARLAIDYKEVLGGAAATGKRFATGG